MRTDSTFAFCLLACRLVKNVSDRFDSLIWSTGPCSSFDMCGCLLQTPLLSYIYNLPRSFPQKTFPAPTLTLYNIPLYPCTLCSSIKRHPSRNPSCPWTVCCLYPTDVCQRSCHCLLLPNNEDDHPYLAGAGADRAPSNRIS
jgi:hypothetical protein